jgi:hypothetical protein
MFVWVGAFEFLLFRKTSWWLVEKLPGGISMLAFVIYIMLLCTPKT